MTIKIFAAVLLFIAALMLPAGPVPAEVASTQTKPSRDMIMHRSQAGEPDATGWFLAESTKGEFSVVLPGKFDDFTLIGIAPDGVAILSDVVKSTALDGTKFSAFRVVRKDGVLPAGSADKIAEKFRQKSFYFKKKKMTFLGMQGYEIVARDETSQAVVRVFQDSGHIYELLVEYPSMLAPAMEPDVSRFMESFTFRQP